MRSKRGGRTCFAAVSKPALAAMVSAIVLCLGVQIPRCQAASTSLLQSGSASSSRVSKSPEPSVWTVGDTGAAIWSLHVMLSELGYLPCHYEMIVPTDQLYPWNFAAPPLGYWVWDSPGVPADVLKAWDPERYSELTKGAVMHFEADHGLKIDGYAGPRVRESLEWALALHVRAESPYRVVVVDQAVPERLRVWEAGRGVVFESLCSTGVPEAPTEPGVHVIFLRNREQVMQGVGPSGRPYRVEHVPYVSFFYGEQAIHGFQRAAYGTPQSAGCVELPVPAASRVWALTHYGTVVCVLPPPAASRQADGRQ
ncbi:L,D-transpeptidase family protein [Alicyclobacillus vulcanalis]|uniref:L,D-transpeptidase catalytic domain n=1 Tax=Alicyclobacillus vulcanalis TaxID=252246 RepID=A0A1N7MXZ5_9BACL|nr:L,D-transpeptidase family protein [Alicyclobacillus vulcanalis]SIS90888.1 L,D-transpeptidase catalytic domain [Alicyclobacillus vulcanalis]